MCRPPPRPCHRDRHHELHGARDAASAAAVHHHVHGHCERLSAVTSPTRVMQESSSTRIELATFFGAALRRRCSTDSDEILAAVEPEADTFIHVAQASVASSRKILEHFLLPSTLAEQICTGNDLELDTSSPDYV